MVGWDCLGFCSENFIVEDCGFLIGAINKFVGGVSKRGKEISVTDSLCMIRP